jgi:hypothetical protein
MCLKVAGMCPKVAGFMFDDDFFGVGSREISL